MNTLNVPGKWLMLFCSHARGLLLRIIVTLETYSVCTLYSLHTFDSRTKYSLHTFNTYNVQFTYI